jgi:hypothetical protein
MKKMIFFGIFLSLIIISGCTQRTSETNDMVNVATTLETSSTTITATTTTFIGPPVTATEYCEGTRPCDMA